MGADAAVGCGVSKFGVFNLGDLRLNERAVELLESFIAKPSATIGATLKSVSAIKAAYRFFGTKNVTQEKLLAAHTKLTAQRCDEAKVILAIQDTTTANYSSHEATNGLGHIGSAKARKPAKGLFIHTTMAVNTVGTPLGFLGQKIWSRKNVKSDGRNARRIRLRRVNVEDKESYRWISAMLFARAKLDPSTCIINVCDRESDIYEFMSRSLEQHSSFIVRAKSDRKVKEDDSDDEIFLLSESFGDTKPIANATVKIAGNGVRKARIAKIAIFARRVFIQPPERSGSSETLAPLEVTAMHVCEINPPKGVDPISWLLLTDLEAPDAESAKKIVRWYSYRWRIEEYHKVLKSGCNVEECRLGTAEKLSKLIVLKSIAAFRICELTYAVV